MASPFRKYAYYLLSISELLTGFREWPLVMRIFLGLAPADQHVIHLRRGNICFRVRQAMDVWSVKETFLDRFYEKYGAPIGAGWQIIDVGAGIGEFTLLAALRHPDNMVYACEPFPQSFTLLQENLKLNEATNVRAFAEAVSDETGALVLDLSSGEPLQVQSFAVESGQASQDMLSVPSVSLADLFARLGLERCHLLKLDCEGAEYTILFNTPEAILARIERIVMEYHDNANAYTHQDLVHYLQKKGFQVKTNPNQVHGYLGYLYAWRG
jgi:FkbM family methyltransferase